MLDVPPPRATARHGVSADLIEQLPEALAVLGPDGAWRRANGPMCAALACTPDAIGGPLHRERLPGVATRIDRALADRTAIEDLEVPETADGRRWRLALRPLGDGDWLLRLHDDGRLRALEAQHEMLAFGISHELRAPVRAIEQFARRLLQQGADADPQVARDHLGRIQDAAAHAGGLIDALLEAMRAPRAPRPAAPVDIGLLVDWIGAELQDADPQRAAQIDVAPDLWAWGDEHALKQMLGKLLHNAWKFSAHRDVVRIGVTGQRVGRRLHLQVRDHGRGFDMRYAERLFVPFRRLHSAEEGAGHGLGLAIAQQLARAQGGHIRVESAPDAGTTFHIELPAVPDEDAPGP